MKPRLLICLWLWWLRVHLTVWFFAWTLLSPQTIRQRTGRRCSAGSPSAHPPCFCWHLPLECSDFLANKANQNLLSLLVRCINVVLDLMEASVMTMIYGCITECYDYDRAVSQCYDYACVCVCFHIIPYVTCFGRTVLYVCIEYIVFRLIIICIMWTLRALVSAW